MTGTALAVAAPELGPLGDTLVAALDRPGLAPLALLVAVAAGALHALAPGHGKSLAAAYLVGSQGRPRDAVVLGGTVAAMHTCSVLVIGLLWSALAGSGMLDVSGVGAVLKVIAGLLVVGAGAVLVRARRHGDDHGRGHSHDHSHGSSHARAAGAAIGSTVGATVRERRAAGPAAAARPEEAARPGVVLLGVSGGLVPSPAAFLLLLTGLFSGRTGLALLLVTVFGIGMAAVLTAVGLATLAGRDTLRRRAPGLPALRRLLRVAPNVAAYGVLLGGVALTGSALLTVVQG